MEENGFRDSDGTPDVPAAFTFELAVQQEGGTEVTGAVSVQAATLGCDYGRPDRVVKKSWPGPPMSNWELWCMTAATLRQS